MKLPIIFVFAIIVFLTLPVAEGETCWPWMKNCLSRKAKPKPQPTPHKNQGGYGGYQPLPQYPGYSSPGKGSKNNRPPPRTSSGSGSAERPGGGGLPVVKANSSCPKQGARGQDSKGNGCVCLSKGLKTGAPLQWSCGVGAWIT